MGTDLSQKQSAGQTKLVGADTNGVEATYIGSTPGGELLTSSGIRSGGVQGNLALTTANTVYEVKVGAARLANRKLVTLYTTDTTLFWGYTSSVTTATGTPVPTTYPLNFDLNPNDPNVTIYVVSSSSGKNARITESP